MRVRNVRPRVEVMHGRSASRAAMKAWPELVGPVWHFADHLAIAADMTDRPALLAARFNTTGRDPFLHLVARADPAQARRLVSALLLRLAMMEDLPAALVIERDDMVLAEVLAEVRDKLPGAILYPGIDGNVIPLRSAAMTRRIARAVGMPDIATLDLRAVDETIMAPACNRLYRARASA